MQTLLLGPTGLRVSELCLGTATFGEPTWGADADASRRVFETYHDAGGRFFDCANTYAGGRSEELLGAFAAPRRDELVLATKFTAATRAKDPNAWGSHRKSLREALNASLRRLRTDYVDLLWVHAWDELTPLEEIMRALDDEVRAGRVLYAGVSNTPAWAVAHANGLARAAHQTPFCAIQTQYNLAERTAEHELLPAAAHLGLGLLAWAPLAAGVLAGADGRRHAGRAVPDRPAAAAAALATIAEELGTTPVTVALAWLLRTRPVPVIPVVGARTPEHLAAALAARHLQLDTDAIAALDAIAPPPPMLPQAFLRSPDGVDFFDQGLRARVST